uniref:Death domain-containing protein n=1 Tax=Branchiostoma floridae TaxID=7739 RepID=C3YGJ6_BRAFL|eukprot:XP_002604495.1 hypothetical protein BRAFLDRAFT_79206 [Branchiostoma floridae]
MAYNESFGEELKENVKLAHREHGHEEKDKGVNRYFNCIKDETRKGWRDLARHLEFTRTDINTIGAKHPSDASCCLDMLEVWQKRRGSAATIDVLIDALYEAELHTVVDSLRIKYPDFQQILNTIASRLDESDVQLLLRVWSARTGNREHLEINTADELMEAMVKSGCIAKGDLGKLEKDMIAAGISFPTVVQGIPGALQRDTTITVSIVDIPGILRGEEGVSWTSGYPWSLGDDACPRELLDKMLFSPAVEVNLHGAKLSQPVELETLRPPGSGDMECLLLKHYRGKGWEDITDTTKHQIYPDKVSIFLRTFCPVYPSWTDETGRVRDTMVDALSEKTLDCTFSAYIMPVPDTNLAHFHVVCRDRDVKTDEYHEGFRLCGSNKAMCCLFDYDEIDVTEGGISSRE